MTGLDNEKLPSRPQRLLRSSHESGNIRGVVDYEKGEREVNLIGQVVDFKTGVAAGPRVDPFGQAAVSRLMLQGFDLFVIRIDTDNPSFRSHHPGHTEAEVASSGADVEDYHSRFDEIRQNPLRVVKETSQSTTENMVKPVRVEFISHVTAFSQSPEIPYLDS
jgi:hypothetical protein